MQQMVNKLLTLNVTDYNLALSRAAQGGNLTILNQMLDLGANNLKQALLEAINDNQREIIDCLLKVGANNYDQAIKIARLAGKPEIARVIENYERLIRYNLVK